MVHIYLNSGSLQTSLFTFTCIILFTIARRYIKKIKTKLLCGTNINYLLLKGKKSHKCSNFWFFFTIPNYLVLESLWLEWPEQTDLLHLHPLHTRLLTLLGTTRTQSRTSLPAWLWMNSQRRGHWLWMCQAKIPHLVLPGLDHIAVL